MIATHPTRRRIPTRAGILPPLDLPVPVISSPAESAFRCARCRAILPANDADALARHICPACVAALIAPAPRLRGMMALPVTAPQAAAAPDMVSEVRCRQCGGSIPIPPFDRHAAPLGWRSRYPWECAPCVPIAAAARAAAQTEREREIAATRLRRWLRLCPLRYQVRGLDPAATPAEAEEQTDPARIPAHVLAAVEGWQYGPRGLYLTGFFGAGKTRAAMLLLRRLTVEKGIGCEYVLAPDFAASVRRLAMDKPEKLESYIAPLIAAPVLFFDDCGKEKMTQRVGEEFFRIVESRTRAGRPILATSNLAPEAWAAKIDRDSEGSDADEGGGRGIAIVRRITDYCAVVAI